MTKRAANSGEGIYVTFHGAFKNKADAEAKERTLSGGGFIRPRTIRGTQRYVVMSRSDVNPFKKRRRNARPKLPGGGIVSTPAERKAALNALKKSVCTLQSSHKLAGSIRRYHKRIGKPNPTKREINSLMDYLRPQADFYRRQRERKAQEDTHRAQSRRGSAKRAAPISKRASRAPAASQDLVDAFRAQGYSAGVAKKMAQSARGSTFDEQFRSVMIRENPAYKGLDSAIRYFEKIHKKNPGLPIGRELDSMIEKRRIIHAKRKANLFGFGGAGRTMSKEAIRSLQKRRAQELAARGEFKAAHKLSKKSLRSFAKAEGVKIEGVVHRARRKGHAAIRKQGRNLVDRLTRLNPAGSVIQVARRFKYKGKKYSIAGIDQGWHGKHRTNRLVIKDNGDWSFTNEGWGGKSGNGAESLADFLSRYYHKANPDQRPTTNDRRLGKAKSSFKGFHGAPSRHTSHIAKQPSPFVPPGDYWKCGDLIELFTLSDDGEYIGRIKSERAPAVASNPENTQLYFIGGDQNVDASLPTFARSSGKDLIDLGRCYHIRYLTRKSMDKFILTLYCHDFGRDGSSYEAEANAHRPTPDAKDSYSENELPRLIYDRVRKKMALAGGRYKVKPEGIVG